MSKVERLYHLHNILSQRRTPISRQDLMERLECSQATLYRLVNELRDFLGAPIEQDPETRGFYYDRSYQQHFELPGIWISPGELQALLTARDAWRARPLTRVVFDSQFCTPPSARLLSTLDAGPVIIVGVADGPGGAPARARGLRA